MTKPRTILELAGRTIPRTPLGEATLVLIDYQNEYCEGPLKLVGVEAAIGRAEALLHAGRRAGARSSTSPTRARRAACSTGRKGAAISSTR